MRCHVVGTALLCGLALSCGTQAAIEQDSDIEPPASASVEEWKAITSRVQEVHTVLDGAKVLQTVSKTMCFGGFSTFRNVEWLTKNLKFKAFALGANGITHLEIQVVPRRGPPTVQSRCENGYMVGSATALIREKE